jgi:hypothetical protein
MKILIAVDGSECSDGAVEEVSKRPWPADSAVRIISVCGPCEIFPTLPAKMDENPQFLPLRRRINHFTRTLCSKISGLYRVARWLPLLATTCEEGVKKLWRRSYYSIIYCGHIGTLSP